MKSKHLVAALAASAGLMWASAHAADAPPAQAAPQLPPGIIIFELQPAEPGVPPPQARSPEAQGAEGQAPQAAEPGSAQEQAQAQAQEQAMLSMLLLQLLGGMHGQPGGSGAVEMQPLPPDAQRI